MSWVEQEFKRRAIIERGSESLWRNLTMAIETAAEDFNRLFCDGNKVCEVAPCPGTKDNCITITKHHTRKQHTVPIVVQLYLRNSVVYYKANGPRLMFSIDAIGGGATLVSNNLPVEVEDACRTVLEPLLFDEKNGG